MTRPRTEQPDPARWPPCVRCGVCYQRHVEWPEGRVCKYCSEAARVTEGTCTTCGHTGVMPGLTATGELQCLRCSKIPIDLTCNECGQEQPIPRGRRCWRCRLREKVEQCLAVDGKISPQLQPLADSLISMPRANSGWVWLRNSPRAATILNELATGRTALTHEGLDDLPPSLTVGYIRELLIASQILPSRDRHLATFRRWMRTKQDTIASADHQALIQRFVRWDVDRKLTQHAHAAELPAAVMLRAKQRVTVAIQFLEWLGQRDVDLPDCTQHDIDAWFGSGSTTRWHSTPFINWARKQRILRGVSIPPRSIRSSPTIGGDERVQHLRALLLHDELPMHYRLIGAFVLLFGQSLSRIVNLTRDHIDVSGPATRLLLADDDWIDLPEPIATLLRSYLEDGWHTRTAANVGTNWLFPGGMPGQHLHIHRASDALRTAGIPALAARNSTWLQLVREAPPAVLARTLGISPRTAMQHATRAGTDYQAYAAQRAREQER
jgi:hypothetical protein